MNFDKKYRICWVYPFNTKCGIHIYSKRYISELRKNVIIEEIDSQSQNLYSPESINLVNSCNCVHIQYEVSFFLKSKQDIYKKFCSKIHVPIIVTLHEVYKEFPNIFPKNRITGNIISKKIKEIIWDYKHPAQILHTKHEQKEFFAKKIHIHYPYQKNILISKGIKEDKILIDSLPILSAQSNKNIAINKILTLSYSGFLNPNYNLELLFSVLEKLTMPWKFIWIGGEKDTNNNQIKNWINSQIKRKSWENKFIITGWVSEKEQTQFLSKTNIFLAFFKSKSTSASLALAIANNIPTIAIKSPLTTDLFNESSAILLADSNPDSILLQINNIIKDNKIRENLYKSCNEYKRKNSYYIHSVNMINHYKEIIKNEDIMGF